MCMCGHVYMYADSWSDVRNLLSLLFPSYYLKDLSIKSELTSKASFTSYIAFGVPSWYSEATIIGEVLHTPGIYVEYMGI